MPAKVNGVAGSAKVNGVAAAPTSSGDDADADDDASDDSFLDKDGRRYRVRSLISESQQGALKLQYALDSRPGRATLCELSARLGFSKRVVQVWFQNMRARQRRRTRLADAKSPAGGAAAVQQVEPLDLSVRGDVASAAASPARSTEQSDDGEEALNLSTKTTDVDRRESASGFERSGFERSGFERSVIYKYLQREGLFRNGGAPTVARPIARRPHDPAAARSTPPGGASSGGVTSPPPSSLDSSFTSPETSQRDGGGHSDPRSAVSSVDCNQRLIGY